MAGNSKSGGSRPGAGRKKGATTTRTQEIAARALADGGKSPLEVIIEAMRSALADGDLTSAAVYAEKAAPYMHPRLSSIDAKVRRVSSWAELSDAELASLVASRSDGGIEAPAEGSPEPDILH